MSVERPDGKHPMEKLIQHFPEAAAIVMDHCVQRSHSDSQERSITYDFRLLDPGPDGQGSGGRAFSGMLSMVKYNQQGLLGHALARKLLREKWSSFGQYVFWGNFALYVAFIAMFTTFLLSEREEVELDDPRKRNRTAIKTNFFEEKNSFNKVVTWLIIIFAVGHTIKEVYQICLQKWSYFRDPVNLIEWALYVSAFGFMLPYVVPAEARIRTTPDLFWQFGTVCVFLGYIDAILFLQTIGFVGLYITMFTEILKTVLKAMLVLILFILAFALVFFILLKEQVK